MIKPSTISIVRITAAAMASIALATEDAVFDILSEGAGGTTCEELGCLLERLGVEPKLVEDFFEGLVIMDIASGRAWVKACMDSAAAAGV